LLHVGIKYMMLSVRFMYVLYNAMCEEVIYVIQYLW